MRQPRSPLVGRTGELARLVEAAGVPGRRGGLVILSGDAGIGKTRLLRHLAEVAQAEGFALAVGRCVARSGSSLPYLPFVEALRGVEAAAPDAVAQTLGVHAALAQVLAGRAPASQLAGSPGGPGAVAEAVHACLSRAGADVPLLVVIEDVHWADLSSLDLLTLLLTRGFDTSVSLVVSYRSDDVHRGHPLHPVLPVWAQLADVTRVELGPLPEPDMLVLVRGLAEASWGPPVTEDAVARIARRAAGNAFFAEELVAGGGDGLGEDLSRVLRLRLEQLDDTARRVVRAVAVGARQVGHETLAAVTGLDEEPLEQALSSALDHHTLELSPGGDFALRHALVGEAVLADLLPGQRRRLHQAYAAALLAEPGLAPASELARHAAAGGDLATAVTASRAAGEAAMAMGGPREALALFEAALSWMDEADPGRDGVSLAAARAAAAAGDVARGVALLDDQLAHPGRSSDAGRARLLAARVILGRLGGDEGSRADAEEAVRLTEGRRDHARVEALAALVQVLVDRNELEDAARVGRPALALAEEVGPPDVVADLRTMLSALVADDTDPTALEQRLRSVIADSAPTDPARTRAHHWLGLLYVRQARLEAALAEFDAGAAVAEAAGRPWTPFGSWCRLRGGLAAYELGDLDGASRRLDMPGPDYPQPAWTAFRALQLAVATARSWSVPPALFDEVHARWAGDPVVVSLSLGPQLELLGRLGRPLDAIALLAEGVAVLDRAWSPTEPILVRLVATLLGVIADAVGGADRATRAELRAAVTGWLPRAEEAFAREAAPGPESRAWFARLDAERRRLAWLDGEPLPVSGFSEAWRAVVASFEAYGNPYEAARSRVCLASVLAAAGDASGADAELTAVRATAEAIGSRSLVHMADAVASASASGPGREGLTAREREILTLLARGLSNGQIGQRLFISTKTASVHVSHILAKLQASTRGEAVDLARRRGVLD